MPNCKQYRCFVLTFVTESVKLIKSLYKECVGFTKLDNCSQKGLFGWIDFLLSLADFCWQPTHAFSLTIGGGGGSDHCYYEDQLFQILVKLSWVEFRLGRLLNAARRILVENKTLRITTVQFNAVLLTCKPFC